MSTEETASQCFARRCIVAGSLLMLAGLVLGAVGTHVVANRVPPRELASFETAVLYQLLHALGLVLLGVIAKVTDVTARLRWAARLMGIGVVVFSGSIYLATAGMPHSVLAVAPSGGMALMASWALLAWHAVSRGRS